MTARRLVRLDVTLDPTAGEGRWRFARAEGPDPAQVLVGRTPQEVAKLAPRIFNLCGAAHGLAAARALGLPQGADDTALARETARDHALAILVDWPDAMGESPERAALAGLVAPGADAATGRRLLLGTDCDLATCTPGELDTLLDDAPSATLRRLACIRREVDPVEGRASLPELTAEDVGCRLAADVAGAAPVDAMPVTARGARAGKAVARETGALGRVAALPLMRALLAIEGPSLFVRLLARLLDLLAALGGGMPAGGRGAQPGIGLAPAARGLLGHGARVEAGRVAAYRVLSPSAWNLAPGGLLERAFAALSIGPQTGMLARLLVCAINPCVPVALHMAGAR